MSNTGKQADNNEVINQKTNQSIVWFTSLPLVVHLVRFGSSLILARLLLPSDFGIMGIVTVIMYYTDTFTDFGFAKALVQKKRILRNHYKSYFSFNIIVSLVLFFVLQIASENIERYFDIEELGSAIQVYSLLLIITALASPAKVKLRREINFKTLAIAEAILVSVSIPTSITLALYDYGFWSMIYGSLISQTVALVFICYRSGLLPLPSVKLYLLKPLLHFSKWDFLAGQTKLIADSVDKIIIGKILGASAVGLYDRALGLAQMPYGQTSGKIGNIAFSTFSRFQDSPEELLKNYSQITTLNALLLFPLLLGLAAVSDIFVYTVLGQKWEQMILTLQVFCISFVFAGLTATNASFNTAIGKISLQTRINLCLTFLLLIGLIFVAALGINYVAFTVMCYQFLSLFISGLIAIKYSKLNLRLIARCTGFPLLAGLIMLICVSALKKYFFIEFNVLNLLSLASIGGLIFLLTVYALPVTEFNFFREWIKRRIKKIF